MATKAVQQIMLGTICKSEVQALETLKAIKGFGYDGIELNHFMMEPSSFLVRALTNLAGMPTGKGGNFNWKQLVTEADLKVVSIHADLGSLERKMEKFMTLAKEFKTDKLVITGMYRFDYKDLEALTKLCTRLNDMGKRLREENIFLLYHNHNIEFQRLENGQFVYDYILEHTNPEYVFFEFDSYWAAEAGVDTVAVMKKLKGRMKLYHVNDRGARMEKMPMTPILNSDSLELGAGCMNLEGLITEALEQEVDAIVLESHKNWVENSPLECIKRSGIFLKHYL